MSLPLARLTLAVVANSPPSSALGPPSSASRNLSVSVELKFFRSMAVAAAKELSSLGKTIPERLEDASNDLRCFFLATTIRLI